MGQCNAMVPQPSALVEQSVKTLLLRRPREREAAWPMLSQLHDEIQAQDAPGSSQTLRRTGEFFLPVLKEAEKHSHFSARKHGLRHETRCKTLDRVLDGQM